MNFSKNISMVLGQAGKLICMCMVFLVWFCLHTWRTALSVGQFLVNKGHLLLLFGLEG